MTDKTPGGEALDINAIMALIPHRYPMLLVDKVVDLEKGKRARGLKGVTLNEPFFQGHFPARPIMPGVLIVEALAQTAAVVTMHDLGGTAEGKLVYFMSIDSAKFRRPVVPGDLLELLVEEDHSRGTVRRFKGKAVVAGKTCAEAVFTAMIAEQ